MRINYLLSRIFPVTLLLGAANFAYAGAAKEAVYALAQDCVVIQSPKSGEYLKRMKGPLGIIDRYGFEDNSLSAAERFYLKPTALGEFLLYDRDRDFISSNFPSTTIVKTTADKTSEWTITAKDSDGKFLYNLENNNTGKSLDRTYQVFIFPKKETHFDLVSRPSSECKSFPEVELNVSAPSPNPADLMQTSPQAIRGYIDGHNHMTAEEFGAGISIAGQTFHKWGVEHALKDCDHIHGKDGKLDLLGSIVGGYASHNTSAWPNFTKWPSADVAETHTGYYYKWVERAHLSGLRMMVVYTVENEVLCKINKALGKFLFKNQNKSCDTLDSVKRQVDNLEALQDYVDAQSGGPNKGFFRIVRSPAEARAVIAQGKLAVVMGIEASETFNCSSNNNCDAQKLMDRLDTYHAMGIRTIFPVHKFDTKFGGATLDTPQLDIMNIGSALENGHAFRITTCDPSIRGRKLTSGFIDIEATIGLSDMPAGLIKSALEIVVGVVQSKLLAIGPVYDPEIANGKACNSRGLLPLGAQLIHGMIDRKILIDVDHQSTEMTSKVLDIAEQRGYSGVVASHGDTDENNIDSSEPNFNYVRLAKLGGHISALTRSVSSFRATVTPGYKAMTRAANEKSYFSGIGIGTDYNSLIKMPKASPFSYPFTNEFGITFNKQVSGNRTFDFSIDGMAHYGLLPELMESYKTSLTSTNDSAIYESIMNSAESYLQMWERAYQ